MVVVGWTLSSVCALAIVYGPYYLVVGAVQGNNPSPSACALYNSVHMTVWGACVAWLIFACTNGYGGSVYKVVVFLLKCVTWVLNYMFYVFGAIL